LSAAYSSKLTSARNLESNSFYVLYDDKTLAMLLDQFFFSKQNTF
jgi:hypothetical protein